MGEATNRVAKIPFKKWKGLDIYSNSSIISNSNKHEEGKMKKKFRLKGHELWISAEDVMKATKNLPSGISDKIRFYAIVEKEKYPVRMLAVELVKLMGKTIPDITTHQAINIIRSLGFDIFET